MSFEKISLAILRLRFNAQKRIEFYRALILMQKGSVQQDTAITKIKEIYSENGKKPNAILAIVADEALHGLKSGLYLHEALADWLPHAETSLLAAGHKSADLSRTLADAILLIKRQKEMLGAVVGNLTYPFFLLIFAGSLLHIAATTIVPGFIQNRSGEADFYGAGYALYILSYAVTNFGVLAVVVLTVLVGLIFYSFPRWTGQLRVRFDDCAPWSIYRAVHGAIFLSTVAVMQRAGVSQMDCLAAIARHSTPWLEERIEYTMHGLKQGLNFGASLANAECNFPSAQVLPFLTLLADQDGFEDALTDFADEWMEETKAFIKKACSIISMFALLGIAILGGVMWAGLQSMATQ